MTYDEYYTYSIVHSNIKDDEDNDVLTADRPISSAVLEAIGNRRWEFSMHQSQFKIIWYKNTDLLKPYEPVHITNKHIIWVFRRLSSITCFAHKHELKTIIAFVKTKKTNKIIEIPVITCIDCVEKYFISEPSLANYERLHGEILIQKIDYEHYYSLWNAPYDDYGMSELYSHGYNVREKTSWLFRRQKLIDLMESGKMTKEAIIRDLSDNINRFYNNDSFENADTRWREDLRFVEQYMIGSKEFIFGELKYRD